MPEKATLSTICTLAGTQNVSHLIMQTNEHVHGELCTLSPRVPNQYMNSEGLFAASALDTATEQGIMNSLDELAKGRTSVFVAHRLSTVMNCDRIFVLARGQLEESGSHAELMARGGVYAGMWDMQAGSGSDSEFVEMPQLVEAAL